MKTSPGRVLGIDYGSRRVGVAVSDPLQMLAGGVGRLANDSTLLDKLAAIVHEQEASLVVVGMPYAPDGGKGAKALEVEAFIGLLRAKIRVPIETWDESFTTAEAHQAFREGGMRRKQRAAKGKVDEMAARLLLQGFLDENGKPAPESLSGQ